MSKYVRLFFNRKKKATATVAGAIEIVVCLRRERCYFHSGHSVTLSQWENGMVVNHPRAVVINEEIQKKVTEFEHILIAMQVNKDDMTIAQFKTYLSVGGGNRRNFMAWLRERINNRPLREGTRKGHLTTYKALERFGKFKTFDDVTLQHIYQFDLFIGKNKPIPPKANRSSGARLQSTTTTSVSSRMCPKRSVLVSSKRTHTSGSKTSVGRKATVLT